MAASPIPEEIRRFILTSIPSVPHLEALLLLRSQETECWQVALVATRLYISDKTAASLLDDLCHAGMAIELDAGNGAFAYRYQPGTSRLRAAVDALADLYARYLVDITHLIHSKLDRKAQQFADAFKWRKDS
ncbi:MAG: hypothetical protein V4723_09020 [Pseudomonadota bacterium]